jgi:hypothetical protein
METWINVTQKLPDNKTQVIRVNTDLIERVGPLGSGVVIVFQSGAQIELVDSMKEWTEAIEGRRWTHS